MWQLPSSHVALNWSCAMATWLRTNYFCWLVQHAWLLLFGLWFEACPGPLCLATEMNKDPLFFASSIRREGNLCLCWQMDRFMFWHFFFWELQSFCGYAHLIVLPANQYLLLQFVLIYSHLSLHLIVFPLFFFRFQGNILFCPPKKKFASVLPAATYQPPMLSVICATSFCVLSLYWTFKQ